jgi:hypothetical protein
MKKAYKQTGSNILKSLKAFDNPDDTIIRESLITVLSELIHEMSEYVCFEIDIIDWLQYQNLNGTNQSDFLTIVNNWDKHFEEMHND